MSANDDQCVALTEDGERCSRPADDGDFCHQHDDSDPTVDEATGSVSDADSDDADSDDADRDNDPKRGDGGSLSSSAGDLIKVRRTVEQVATELLTPELDTIIEIRGDEEGWHATFECIERPGIPDTQDILGRYEITLDAPDSVTSYRRVDRYRRGDTDRRDTLE